MMCFGLLFAYYCEVPKPAVIDGFCERYQKVIVEKGDGTITGTPGAKRRLAANEIIYKCQCEKWQSPLCK